jgi:hypothetical protein
MIEQVFGDGSDGTSPPAGRQLDPDNLDAWLADARRQRERYRAARADNLRWLDQVAAQYGDSPVR